VNSTNPFLSVYPLPLCCPWHTRHPHQTDTPFTISQEGSQRAQEALRDVFQPKGNFSFFEIFNFVSFVSFVNFVSFVSKVLIYLPKRKKKPKNPNPLKISKR